jgi:predicted amidohydrolase
MNHSETLNIALLHLKIEPGSLERNRKLLLEFADRAASTGAQIILAPELAASGYLTESRPTVSAFVEPLLGPTYTVLADVARRYGVYVCAGFAEKDPQTGICYNSAFAIGPTGEIVAHHRKVLSERRWASPGAVLEQSRFDSPWGRIGLLICADTYCGLLPRTHALRQADLLLVLANWPDCGLDPRELWRARALENGIGVVACNRTGAEPKLDFSPSHSYAVSEDGVELADFCAPESAICCVRYPLDNGRLNGNRRRMLLCQREPSAYDALSLNVNGLADFAAMWGLPKAGMLDVHCAVGDREATAAFHECGGQGGASVRVGEGIPVCQFRLGDRTLTLEADQPFVMADFGPARIALVSPDALRHPELSVALSKQGCDIAVAAAWRAFSVDDRLLLGVKSLDRLAIVTIANNGATICTPPIGHGRWEETVLDGPGECRREIDINTLRRKHFEDRVDLPALLGR